MSEKTDNIQSLKKMTNILLGIIVIMAFFMGIMWQKLQLLETGGSSGSKIAANNPGNNDNPAAKVPPSNATPEDVEAIAQVSAFAEQEEPGSENLGHLRGSENARVFLIEYSDFECPYCASFHPTARRLVDEYPGEVAWVYRHFPLDSIHPNARPTAEASECVFGQYGEDKFWEFADAVFEAGPASLKNLSPIYEEIGVDGESIENCVADGTYADKVDSDFQEGLEAGVTGTPGNLLVSEDGTVIPLKGAVPYENLKAEVEKLLN